MKKSNVFIILLIFAVLLQGCWIVYPILTPPNPNLVAQLYEKDDSVIRLVDKEGIGRCDGATRYIKSNGELYWQEYLSCEEAMKIIQEKGYNRVS